MRALFFKSWLKIKWFVADLLYYLGFPFKYNKSKGSIRVLCFHGICDDSKKYINSRFITLGKFRRLLKTLDAHYHIISLSDFLNNRIVQDKMNILLTFDDGYKNLETYMLPVIHEMRIPVTLFITCRNYYWMDLLDIAFDQQYDLKLLAKTFPAIEKFNSNQAIKQWASKLNRSDMNTFSDLLCKMLFQRMEGYEVFYEVLSRKQLQKLGQHELVSLANHSANHLCFTELSASEMIEEVNQCVHYLKALGSSYYDIFAYPFGKYNQASVEVLRSIDIRDQFIVDFTGPSMDRCHERLVINPHISLHNQLLAIEYGRY